MAAPHDAANGMEAWRDVAHGGSSPTLGRRVRAKTLLHPAHGLDLAVGFRPIAVAQLFGVRHVPVSSLERFPQLFQRVSFLFEFRKPFGWCFATEEVVTCVLIQLLHGHRFNGMPDKLAYQQS